MGLDWAMRSLPPSPAADQKGTRLTNTAAVLAPPVITPVSLCSSQNSCASHYGVIGTRNFPSFTSSPGPLHEKIP
jgi:hypothetical protein